MRHRRGAARGRLTARLNGLVSVGLLERRVYSTAPPRTDYHLTRSGRDLLQVLLGLGDRWVAETPPVKLHHDGHRAGLAWTCRTCARSAEGAPVERVLSAAGRALQEDQHV